MTSEFELEKEAEEVWQDTSDKVFRKWATKILKKLDKLLKEEK